MKLRKSWIIPVCMFQFGAGLGVISKLLDLYTTNLGEIFSQMSVWILICTLIAIYSKSRRAAAVNVFVFCVGMLIAYYITAEVTSAVYGMTFVYGWAAFTLCTPLFAAFTWMTKEKGGFPKLISAGILLVTLVVSILLFGGPRIYDFVILAVLGYFLYFRKVR